MVFRGSVINVAVIPVQSVVVLFSVVGVTMCILIDVHRVELQTVKCGSVWSVIILRTNTLQAVISRYGAVGHVKMKLSNG